MWASRILWHWLLPHQFVCLCFFSHPAIICHYFFLLASFFFQSFDVLVTFLQQAKNCRRNPKDRHQTWLEEGHKNNFSWERQSRTWNHSSWSNFCCGWEAPFCFQEGWKWSGGQPENLVIGSSHRENHQTDNLGWKISPDLRTDIVKPGQELLVSNEGMPISKEPTKRGNLRIKFDVTFPKRLTVEQKSDLKKALGASDN